MLKRLELARVRGIVAGVVEGFADVNVLVGRNNSGKSTIAESLLILAAKPQTIDVLGRQRLDQVGDARNDATRSFAEILHRGEGTATITAVVGGDRSMVSWGSTKPVSASHAPASREFLQGTTLLRPEELLRPLPERTLWASRVLPKRHDKSLAAALQTIFGMEVEGLQLPPDGRMQLLFPDHSIALDNQGDGARVALRTLMVLAVMENALLILEEPETHLHAGALRRFAAAACTLAQERHVQLLLTTHSRECVHAFLEAADTVAATGRRYEGVVFHLSLTDGQLDARRLDAATVRTLDGAGTDVRFLDLYA